MHAAKENEEPSIHDLISDAMQEDLPPRPASAQMQRSGERLDKMSSSSKSDAVDTTIVTFSSDSEGEREVLSKFTCIQSSKDNPSKELRKQKLNGGEMEVEEDYCFLFSPTTARVVRDHKEDRPSCVLVRHNTNNSFAIIHAVACNLCWGIVNFFSD